MRILRNSARKFSFLFPESLRQKILFRLLGSYRPVDSPKLNKSAFQSGQYCELHLWKQLKDPSDHPAESQNQYISPKQKSLLRELANRLHPEAKHTKYNNATTRSMLSKGEPIRGAYLETKYFILRADFLLPSENGWDIILVKASSSPKRSAIQELSFYRMIMEEEGFPVSGTYLYYVNSKYYYPGGEIDPKQLLFKKDASKETFEKKAQVKEQAYRMLEILEEPNFPPSPHSKKCDHPRSCFYPDNCFADSPVGDLFTLREGKEEIFNLWNEGIRNLSEVKDLEPLTLRQKIQVQAVQTGQEHWNIPAIETFLKKLKFPLYFLDFETINPPIPVYARSNPFQHIPFLFSLHILRKSPFEEPEEYSYLDDGETDPRLHILTRLRDKIGETGSILAFNDTFEKRCLRESVQIYPEFKSWFNSVEERFIDLALPFWDFDYYHPDQKGSTSLKSVLPVLTGFNYSNLNIGAGYTANSEFLRIKTEQVSKGEKLQVESDLIQYCRMDTLALVLILRKIAERLNWIPES
ncbi:hypothetical protein CH373_01485 [Leptospira perolatii]|uniref:DUF2779 domain-containing protein n=1 Tax=Leptospira perolatii TaxID=2023191 RepID=A0A2M9ZRN4_9LEPT|nr:DUF2779 domain-containing protein [Leptospira perolatii]PJZ71213.1 hypothetical protein CH360_01485 [Leptospira perolatii]PJZ74746.1 hypothetical protein CH373_01485 [Leptospira perolatii]